MTDATASLKALNVDLQVTADPWKRHSPYEGWKVFYRLRAWPLSGQGDGWGTFSVLQTTRIAMPANKDATRMAVLK